MSYKDDFPELWSGVERLITEGKVGGAGLSDLNPPTFFNIYEAAEIKPTSVQVSSCCVYCICNTLHGFMARSISRAAAWCPRS